MTSGERYGKLTAVRLLYVNRAGRGIWEFACDCGGSINTRASNVRRGNIARCDDCGPDAAIRAMSPKHDITQGETEWTSTI